MTTEMGIFELIPTFRCVSVYANFTGDVLGGNFAEMQWRRSGEILWRDGMDLVVDRRPTIRDRNAVRVNPFFSQWRGSLLNLEPDTEYEVMVTFFDPLGVIGVNPIVGTVRTRSEFIPLGQGVARYVSAAAGSDITGDGSELNPWRTLTYSLGQLNPGDTLYARDGATYVENHLVIPGGTSWDNMTSLVNYPGETPVIDGSNVDYTFRLLGRNFWRLQGITVNNCGKANLRATNCSSFIVEDCTFDDSGSGYYGCVTGINSEKGIIRNNRMIGTLVFGGEISGIRVDGNTTLLAGQWIIYNNYINSTRFYDIIGFTNSVLESGFYRDSDIYDNWGENAHDDAFELEGGGSNVRLWGNYIKNNGESVISTTTIVLGPVYVFHNLGYALAGSGMGRHTGFKNGCSNVNMDSDGALIAYHNTMYRIDHAGPSTWGDYPRWRNHTYLNNIFMFSNKGNTFREIDILSPTGERTLTLDYNCFHGIGNAWIYYRYQPLTAGAKIDYPSRAEFYAASGYEEHGIDLDPLLFNPEGDDFRLQPGSPCIDAGVLIRGFNTPDGHFPHTGLAPDIGASDFGAAGAIYTLSISTVTGGTTNPASGVYPLLEGSIKAVTAIPNTDYKFVEWLENGSTIGTVNPITVVMTHDRNLTPVFVYVPGPVTHSLITDVNGLGTVALNPTGGSYVAGTIVTVTANPSAGWEFAGWGGDLVGPINPETIIMDRDKSIAATFTQIPVVTHILTVNGGSGSGMYPENTYANISADPPQQGYEFDGWVGDVMDPSLPVTSVYMDADKIVTATYTQITYTLTIDTFTNGQVAINVFTIITPDMTPYPIPGYTTGFSVSLQAIPDEGYQFVRWSDGNIDAARTITMDGDITIAPIFELAPLPPVAEFSASPLSGEYPLTVSFTNLTVIGTGPFTYVWNFADGATSAEVNPVHTFGAIGTYNVSLTATGPTGLTNTAIVPIDVTDIIPPIAAFRAEPSIGAAPLRVQFYDESWPALEIESWVWDFDDGVISTQRNPVHIFDVGVWMVSLIVTRRGVTDTATLEVIATPEEAPPPLPVWVLPVVIGSIISIPVAVIIRAITRR